MRMRKLGPVEFPKTFAIITAIGQFLSPVKDFCAQSETSIYHASFVIFLHEGINLQTRLLAVDRCICLVVQESFLQEDFSVKMGPQNWGYAIV